MPNPFPSAQTLARARPAVLGLVAGIVGMWVLAAFSTVVYSGKGFWAEAVPPTQVYTDF